MIATLLPRKRFFCLGLRVGLGLTLATMPALAAPNIYERADAKLKYDHCLSLAGFNPAAALGVAKEWATKAKGGAPAEHCAAVALVGLKRYAEAGTKLDFLGRAPGVGDLRAALFDQAGNAWLLAGDAPHAVASFSAALTLSANDADLYADLARAQALQKNWHAVESDLNAGLSIAPRRSDLLLLRASARHALGNLAAARADVDGALIVRPGYAEALLERGTIRRDAGDFAGARSDLTAALKTRATEEAARRDLAAIDAVTAKPGPAPLKK